MPAAAAAAAAAAEGARAIRSCVCAASVCRSGACARAWGDRSLSPAQQPQRMPLGSRFNQLSIVLDPARLSQRARRADRLVRSAAERARRRQRAAGYDMSASYCFQCGVPGG